MATGAILDVECVQGETWRLNFELSTNGIAESLEDYVVHFVITEIEGKTPIIDIASNMVGQTVITIQELLGACEICLPPSLTVFNFLKARYNVILQSPDNDVYPLLRGDYKIILSAKPVLPEVGV